MDKAMLADVIKRYEQCMFTVNRKMNAMMRELMSDELTTDQYSTMRYIRQQGRATSTELADIFCVGKSSITAIITRLTDKKLIERLHDEKDRRVIYLTLTEFGEKLTDEMEDKMQELLAKYIQFFNRDEAVQFIQTFEKLAQVLMQSDEKGSTS